MMTSTSGRSANNPFVCPACGVNYCTLISSPKAPAHIKECGHTMCVHCVLSRRRENKEKKNNYEAFLLECCVCEEDRRLEITQRPVRARTVIEVLLEIEKLKKSSDDGYIETHKLLSMKCPGCKDTYSSLSSSPSSPYIMGCGHAICVTCVEKRKKKLTEKQRKNLSCNDEEYGIRCVSGCGAGGGGIFNFNKTNGYGSAILDVIKWLEKEKGEYIKQRHLNSEFSCLECGVKTPCDRGFVCSCRSTDGDKELAFCAYCILTKHKTHGHGFETFLPFKLQSMKNFCSVDIHSKISHSTSEAKAVFDTSKTLLDSVENGFSSAIKTIPLATSCSNGITIGVNLMEKSEELRDIVDKIVPNVLAQNKKLEDMICKLMETFPELAIREGESKGREETADKETEDGESKRKEENKEKRKIKEEPEDEVDDSERKRPKMIVRQRSVKRE